MKGLTMKFFSRICIFILFSFIHLTLFSAQLATWNLQGWRAQNSGGVRTAQPTTTSTTVTVSDLWMASGIDPSNHLFTNNTLAGDQITAKTLAESKTNNEYYEFTIAPITGKVMTISSINICAMSQGQVCTFSLLSSLDGYTNPISTITTGSANNMNISQQTFDVTGHNSLTNAVTFRIYIYSSDDVRWSIMGIGGHTSGISSDLIVNGSTTAPDLLPPTTPGSLTALSVGATALRLTWTASTDDNEVVGYEIYNGSTLIGTTTNILFLNVMGLTPSTAYTFSVKAKDSANKLSDPATVNVSTAQLGAGYVPKLPIGMNISSFNYYTPQTGFVDAMKMTGDMFTYYKGGPWDSQQIGEIPRDDNGYPIQVPFTTSDGKASLIRFLLNNYYSGDYVLTFDGTGTIEIGGLSNVSKVNNNKYYITFIGNGNNAWLNITSSTLGNHIRNMKILPKIYENAVTYPTFTAEFLDGLRPFHAFRFMDWICTNGSNESNWTNRVTKNYYSQGTSRGASYDYAIELCNELDADAWVTIPHKADDNYITQAAILWRDGLRPNRKVYLEFSNEIWNWQFSQTSYINNNAPGHPNSYISSDLSAIQAAGGNFPEKDAYMMARCFRLWKAQFTGSNTNRLVRVGTGQHGWADNTRRILNYLFDVDKNGCDMFSVAGYFNFQEKDHLVWNTKCSSVTPLEIIDSVFADYPKYEGAWTDNTAAYVNARGIPYIVYEGGQHMQPYLQGEWCYNQAVYDAQIHPKMYDLYMYNFEKMTSPIVNCNLFMAFSYVSPRESKWGSWGHLESLNQIGSASNYMTIAPKYQALLDANAPKTAGLTTNPPYKSTNSNELNTYPNPVKNRLYFNFAENIENATIYFYDIQGRIVKSATILDMQQYCADVTGLKSGIYLIKIISNGKLINRKFVKE
jgi:hypothetical protein